ncbi:MAG: type III-B CRISPR module RAMP protein Cmr6 [Chlorobi bacterium]|nr:type III-B CRISPR module RAMP protein Cmr6 [Chlorobiota bacterium]
MTNLGLEFNKRVYRNIKSGSDNIQYRNDNLNLKDLLIQTKLQDLKPSQLDLSKYFPKNEYYSFSLTTAGQGFLIGTGNEHGTGAKLSISNKKRETHEFKMGFHFDHSTGIPVITGHNLKGRIRSFFPIAYSGNKKELITERLIGDIKECLDKEVDRNFVTELQNAIFEGKELSVSKKDTFLGAYPAKSYSRAFHYHLMKKGTNSLNETKVNIAAGTFLFEDTLAHHKHPLKDPNPIRFLKILPNVEIKFQFRLFDSGGLSADEKVKLFEFLLQKYGAGAKTSSGYGQFKKNISQNKISDLPVFGNFIAISLDNKGKIPETSQTTQTQQPKKAEISQDDTWVELDTLKIGSLVWGTVLSYSNGNAKIKLHIKDKDIVINVNGKFSKTEKAKLIITETSGKIEKGNFTITKVRKKK